MSAAQKRQPNNSLGEIYLNEYDSARSIEMQSLNDDNCEANWGCCQPNLAKLDRFGMFEGIIVLAQSAGWHSIVKGELTIST